MTDWRTAPIRQEEIDRDNDQKAKAESQPAGTSAILEPRAEGKAQHRSFAGQIKDLFRNVMEALTGKSIAPNPKRRRKRGEDTRGMFKKLAMKILAPVVRRIIDPGEFHWFSPPDELDETQRLIMRQWHSEDAWWQQHGNDAFRYDQSNNHLSPRL
jgi:hypothetical protein